MRAAVVRGGLLAGVTAVVVACVLWGQELNRSKSEDLALEAPPFVGEWVDRWGARSPIAVAVAGVVIAWGPAVAARLSFRALLPVAVLTSGAWAVSLALVDGAAGLAEPLREKDEYLYEVPRVHDVTGFLSTFTSHINDDPHHWLTHVSGHPPGLLLLLAGMDRVGLGGLWPFVVLCVGAGCSAVAAVLLTVRTVVDEPTARRCAPFLVLLPAAIWVAVSPDAVFLGVTAWGVALLALGATRGSDRLSLAGGVVLGLSLFLTYGVLTLGVIVLSVVVVTRRWRSLVLAAVGVLAVGAVFSALGFWWFDGLHETLVRYRAGAGGYRPYEYFVVADLAVLAVGVGPAALAGFTALARRDRLWWLVGATLVAVTLADLSGASKAEVERIWLPFTPWLVLGAARLTRPRLWLGLQVALAVAVQSSLLSKW